MAIEIESLSSSEAPEEIHIDVEPIVYKFNPLSAVPMAHNDQGQIVPLSEIKFTSE